MRMEKIKEYIVPQSLNYKDAKSNIEDLLLDLR